MSASSTSSSIKKKKSKQVKDDMDSADSESQASQESQESQEEVCVLERNEEQDHLKTVDKAEKEAAERLFAEIRKESFGLKLASHRRMVFKYENAFEASQLVALLQSNKTATSVDKAVELGNNLVRFNLLHHVNDSAPFADSADLFRFRADDDSANRDSAAKLTSDATSKFGPVKYGSNKNALLVFQASSSTLFMFASEIAAEPTVAFKLAGKKGLLVSDRGTNVDLELKIVETRESLQFVTQSATAQEAWIKLLVESAGGTFETTSLASNAQSVFEFKLLDIDLKPHHLDQYRGKVVLVVNVASACGLTAKNYEQLPVIAERYKDDLVILAFPCNQFAMQEPGSNATIKKFAAERGAKFPLFDKVHVNGSSTAPIYAFLRSKLNGTLGNAVKWNFSKFLCNREGVPVARFSPYTTPFELEEEIKKLI